VGTYTASLARALSEATDGSLALIGVRPDAGALEGVRAASRRPFRAATYHAWLQLHADRQARQAGAHLAHYTSAGAPVFVSVPYVLTVYDLSLVRHPRSHPLKRLATVPVMLWAIGRARAVSVPSEWTRSELGRLELDRRRIVVIPPAPAAMPDPSSDDAAGLLAALGLAEGRYVLAIGTIEPRKNLIRLIEAFELIAPSRPDLALVLAGAPGWHRGPILARAARSSYADRILVTGYVSSSELAALTQSSGAVAYVSVYEGYGMPVLDAMSVGAAVVTSNCTSMPEAAGGAAVLVDPFDSADMARGLERAFTERDQLVAAGLARATRRSWADVAAEHVELYRWVASRS